MHHDMISRRLSLFIRGCILKRPWAIVVLRYIPKLLHTTPAGKAGKVGDSCKYSDLNTSNNRQVNYLGMEMDQNPKNIITKKMSIR